MGGANETCVLVMYLSSLPTICKLQAFLLVVVAMSVGVVSCIHRCTITNPIMKRDTDLSVIALIISLPY